jgi:hypothetical protein
MPDRFSKVSEDIYRGGEPSEKDLQILSDVFGINRIISLDGKIGYKIHPIVKKLGMEHIIIPLGGKETENLFNYLKKFIINLFEGNTPTYVHCRHGSDRTGIAVALYRIQNDNWPKHKALREAREFGFGNKIPKESLSLYIDTIKNPEPDEQILTLDDDVVSQMRDWFDFGNVPPAFAPQQSFAPRFPIFYEPYHPEIEKDRKERLRKNLIEVMQSEQVPMVGQYDNSTGIRGVGPVENHGGFINL